MPMEALGGGVELFEVRLDISCGAEDFIAEQPGNFPCARYEAHSPYAVFAASKHVPIGAVVDAKRPTDIGPIGRHFSKEYR